MKIVNVSNIEDLVLTKYEIEERLIKEHKLKEKYDIAGFINNFIHFGDNVWLLNDHEVYPFELVTTGTGTYLFITEDENSERSKAFLSIMSNIQFNVNNLIKIPDNELDIDYSKKNIFIINGKYYHS